MKKSHQDDAFDQLLNKCSWSYKELNTCRKGPMKTDINSLQSQRTFISRMPQDRDSEVEKDKSTKKSKNGLEAFDKSSAPENGIREIFRKDPPGKTKFQEKTKSLNMTTEVNLENLPKMTSTPNPRTQLDKKSARELIVEIMSSSGSDDEVFQTRLSEGSRYIPYEEQSSSVENDEHKKYTCDFTARNSAPIIIQAKPYDNVITTHSCNKFDAKNPLEMNHDLGKDKERIVNRDPPSVEASSFNVERRNSHSQYSIENHDELNCEKRKKFLKDSGENSLLNELMNKITVTNGNDSNDSKEMSDSLVTENFLNGSLDVSFYKSDSRPVKKNVETNAISDWTHLKKFKLKNPKETSNKIKKKQQPKNTKTPLTVRAMRNTKTKNRAAENDKFNLDTNLKSKSRSRTQKRQKTDKTLTNSTSKSRKSRNKKKSEEDQVLFETSNEKSPIKHSPKMKRNCSLIASRKIKEIEQLEDKFDNQEEISLSTDSDECSISPLKKMENKVAKYNFGIKKNNYCYTAKNDASSYDYEYYDQNTDEISSNESLPLFSARKNNKDSWQAKYDRKFDDINNTYVDSGSSTNYLKDNKGKYLTSHTSGIDNYLIKSEDLNKNPCYKSKKCKKDNRYSKSKQNVIFSGNENLNKINLLRDDEIQSVMTYNKPITRSRKRTWDSLEKELLEDLDGAKSCGNKVCEKEVFKKQKLVGGQNINDSNLHSLPNTIMKQTIKRSDRRKAHNTYVDSGSSKNYFKDNKEKYLTSHTSGIDNYLIQSEDLNKNPYHTSQICKKDNRYSKSKQNVILGRNENLNKRNLLRNDEIQSVMTYSKPITRSRKRTWDSLEKELLEDLDGTKSCGNEVCEKEVFKKQKLVGGQNINDSNLYSLPNTIIKQTIKRSDRIKVYDTQYGLNTKKDIELRRTNITSKDSKALSNTYTKEIVPSYPKSVSIVENTIAAMERCTAKFIAPQANVYKSNKSSFVIEDKSNNSNISHEALFHSNITFMSSKNKRYYKNEVVGYLKKKSLRQDELRNSNGNEFENSNDAEHFIEMNELRKSYHIKDSAVSKQLNNETNQAMVLSTGAKCNPWSKLMLELNVNQDKKADESQKKISNLANAKPGTSQKDFNKLFDNNEKKKTNLKVLNIQQYVQNEKRNEQENSEGTDDEAGLVETHEFSNIPNIDQDNKADESQRKISNLANAKPGSYQKDFNKSFDNNEKTDKKKINLKALNIQQYIQNERKNEQENSEGMDDETVLVETHEFGNIPNVENFTFNTKTESKPVRNKKFPTELENETVMKKLSQPVRKLTRNDTAKMKKVKKSPTFQLQMSGSGRLNLLETLSSSSIVTDSSIEIIEPNEKSVQGEKNDCSKYEAIEKYKNYLKKKLEGNSSLQNNIEKVGDEIMLTEAKKVEEKVIEVRTGNQEENNRLIAEDDLFSLSSDSESDSIEYKGTGLLCDILDE